MLHSGNTMSVATPPRTYRSGQWMVIECHAGLDASSAGWLRGILANTSDASWLGVVIDFSGLRSLDLSGRRLLQNFHRSLVEKGRSLGLVADKDELRQELSQEEGVTFLASLSELKRSIHEMPPDRMLALQSLGTRNGNLLAFRLRCPVCRCDEVKGWLPEPRTHKHIWVPEEITRQLVYTEDPENAFVVDLYNVAVCPECLFAANRIDWFDLPGSHLPSTLPEGGVERLAKSFARRRAVVAEGPQDISFKVWFGMPRTQEAVCCAWSLCEESLRALGRDRSTTDGFGIALSILMQAKFAGENDDLEQYYTAAYVWLKQVVEQFGNYAEDRLVEAAVYLLSVELALGRDADAQGTLRMMETRWGNDPEFKTWVERSRQLLH